MTCQNCGDLQKQPPEVFHKKAVLKNLVIFTGKLLCVEVSFFCSL